MKRYTFKYESGSSAGCFYCGNVAIGIQTDKATGEEWWSCKSCIKAPGFCRRTQLHPDFKKPEKNGSDLRIKKRGQGIQ